MYSPRIAFCPSPSPLLFRHTPALRSTTSLVSSTKRSLTSFHLLNAASFSSALSPASSNTTNFLPKWPILTTHAHQKYNNKRILITNTKITISASASPISPPSSHMSTSSSSSSLSSSSSSSSSSPANLPYDHLQVERKWQTYWDQHGTFVVPDLSDPAFDASKPKFYALDMFPYPSGAGLHVGHPEGYTATDIMARYKRMQGFNVMHPMGWDAFGLPAEQYAIQTGTHPSETTKVNVARFRQQLKMIGFSYDWTREVSTTDISYYKWTQWIFKQLFLRDLAYQAEANVNWCEELGTVLANEEVIDGLSERGGFPVIQRPMKQWVLKITEYAERLLDDLDSLDWPESIKEMQRNWIGKSRGAQLSFPVLASGGDDDDNDSTTTTTTHDDLLTIAVFTTRPETVRGVSYVVLAPEYARLDQIVQPEWRPQVELYRQQAAAKSERERTAEAAAGLKTGVFTGAYALNPFTNEKVPIWVADYVVATYGTGAVMAVPAHDARDYAFAKQFDLPLKKVVVPADPNVDLDLENNAFVDQGVLINWDSTCGLDLDGMDMIQARDKILDFLDSSDPTAAHFGSVQINYKLRDWLFARQRYWGEPFPIIYVDGNPKVLPDDHLPVTLPEVVSFKPSGSGDSPLAVVHEWVNTVDPDTGAPALRETNTMPQWAGSCWYYLRFLDPNNPGAPIDPKVEKYWMPVDLYVGGVEHAVLHLLYARFWHKVLYDVGVVSTKEPFQKLVNQGIILGEVENTVYQSPNGNYVSARDVDIVTNTIKGSDSQVISVKVDPEQVEKRGDVTVLKSDPNIVVTTRAHKMSKSRGNVVNPDRIVEDYGADALRLYLMFMGPLEQVKPWSTLAVSGMARFLARVYRLVVDPETGLLSSAVVHDEAPTKEHLKILHTAIKRVTEDTEGLRFNTAIAAMTEFVNAATKWEKRSSFVLQNFVLLIAPYCPHLAEELWQTLGNQFSLAYHPWPQWNEKYLVADTVTIVVQINGKVKAKLDLPADMDKDAILQTVKSDQGVTKLTEGKSIKKEIYVPGKLVNLVVA